MKTMLERLRPRLGPGIVVALVVAGVVLWHNWRWEHSRKPLIVEHQTVSSTGPVGVPDPSFVLQRGDELKLSADQRTKVRTLAGEYEAAQAPLLKQSGAAVGEAMAKLAHLKETGKRAKMDSTSQEAQAVSDASRRLSDLRVRTWPKLTAVLTEEQSRQAKTAWAEAHTLTAGAAKRGGGG